MEKISLGSSVSLATVFQLLSYGSGMSIVTIQHHKYMLDFLFTNLTLFSINDIFTTLHFIKYCF